MLARKLQGQFFSFPVLNPLSATGGALLSLLVHHPKELEKNPEWWAHMYCANLFESRPEVVEALKQGPVVVTNYTHSFRVWAQAVFESEDIRHLLGYVRGLPKPHTVLSVWGEAWQSPNNFPVKFSQALSTRIRLAHQHSTRTKRFSLIWDEERYRHIILNKCIQSMAEIVCAQHPHVKINPFSQYTMHDFVK